MSGSASSYQATNLICLYPYDFIESFVSASREQYAIELHMTAARMRHLPPDLQAVST